MAIALIAVSVSSVAAAEYTVSGDFDIIEGKTNASHQIRIYALQPGLVHLNITTVDKNGGPVAQQATIQGLGAHTEINVPAGTKINSDGIVVAIEFNGQSTWVERAAMAGTDLTVGGCSFFLIASAGNGTSISADLNDDQSSETANLNAGYAVVCSGDSPKQVTSDKAVIVIPINVPNQNLGNAYLLAPNSAAYQQLYLQLNKSTALVNDNNSIPPSGR